MLKAKILGIDQESIDIAREWSERTQGELDDYDISMDWNDINTSDESFSQDELAKFYSRIKFIESFNSNYREIALKLIRKDFRDLWLRVKKMRNQSKDAKMVYYQISPYFEDLNLKSMISNKFDSIVLPNGWLRGQLYCFSSNSGGGKTSLAVMITTALISGCNPLYDESNKQDPQNVLYINLEQDETEIEKRIISCLSAFNNVEKAIPYSDMMNPSKLSGNENLLVATQVYRLFSDRVKILNTEDFPSLDVDDICDVISKQTMKKKYGIVIIDQNQNIKDSDLIQERNATRLRHLAKSIQLPVVILSQMNKGSQTEARNPDGSLNPNKITGSALKGSNAIEQQSSNVVFILPTKKIVEKFDYEAELVNIITPKGRYGGGDIQMLFIKQFNLFVDPDSDLRVENEDEEVVSYNAKL